MPGPPRPTGLNHIALDTADMAAALSRASATGEDNHHGHRHGKSPRSSRRTAVAAYESMLGGSAQTKYMGPATQRHPVESGQLPEAFLVVFRATCWTPTTFGLNPTEDGRSSSRTPPEENSHLHKRHGKQ